MHLIVGCSLFLTTIWCFFGISYGDYLSLDGDQWTTHCQNKSITSKAIVPGSVYTDLERTGHVVDTLLSGYNDVNYRWVAWDNWTYEREFDVDSKLLAKQVVNLVAEGVDTVSTIYINDQKVGQTNNQFVRYKFDTKSVLKSGKNTIKVVFESALTYSSRQSHLFKEKYHYDIIPGCMSKEYHGECHNSMIRKMQSSYSWDWGPAFPTQGIWKPIGIEAYDKAIVRDITVETTPDKTNASHWVLNMNVFVESDTKQKFDTKLTVHLDDHPLVTDKAYSLTPDKDGNCKIKIIIPVDSMTIIPWFPNGVSANTQQLYALKATIGFPDSSEVSQQTRRIGFRTIEVIQTPIQPKGLTFYFQVNGQPFYAKGTNWIPADNLQERITRDYLRDLMESAREANMNMMRVWGGGVYESDYLYELADEYGIMIWQDFMFACSLYPADPDFLATVDVEVVNQMRRLQHHPSIALWAGNNENEGWVHRGAKNDTAHHKTDYIELYIHHIRKLILAEDQSRTFVGSSPSNGDEEVQEDWVSTHSSDLRYGDVHHYEYSKPLWNWRLYPSGKFASEYGYISYPSIHTWLTALNESDLTYPIGKALEHRQHHPGGTKSIENNIDHYFKMPSHGGVDRFADLVYLSQIIQAEAMKIETEFYRRNRALDPKTGNGNTMGALFWQINDIWQGTTWAAIEYGGKWKLLQSFAINFFANQLVSAYEDTNQTFKLDLVRDDYGGAEKFDLWISMYKWSSTKPTEELQALVKSDKGFSVSNIWTQSIPDMLQKFKCPDRSECVIRVEIPQLKASNYMMLTEPKNAKLVKPNIKVVEVKRKVVKDLADRQVFDITLSAEAVAPYVALDFKFGSTIKGQFPENGFFIFDPKKTVQFVTRQTNVTEKLIQDNLTIKTVTDVV